VLMPPLAIDRGRPAPARRDHREAIAEAMKRRRRPRPPAGGRQRRRPSREGRGATTVRRRRCRQRPARRPRSPPPPCSGGIASNRAPSGPTSMKPAGRRPASRRPRRRPPRRLPEPEATRDPDPRDGMTLARRSATARRRRACRHRADGPAASKSAARRCGRAWPSTPRRARSRPCAPRSTGQNQSSGMSSNGVPGGDAAVGIAVGGVVDEAAAEVPCSAGGRCRSSGANCTVGADASSAGMTETHGEEYNPGEAPGTAPGRLR
jgi:hypothetical protein